MQEFKVDDVVAFVMTHPWHGCIAVVTEPKSFGAVVDVRDPRGGSYPIRVRAEELVYVGSIAP